MYSIVHVVKNMRPVTLCFANKESAESFLNLVNVYEDDAGAGNGYDAYWPNYEKREVSQRFFCPWGAVKELDRNLVDNMLDGIFHARVALHRSVWFTTMNGFGGIRLLLGDLPQRLRPTVGDMYRMPRSLSPDGMGGEGIVIEDCGDMLKVIPCQYWRGDGFRSDVEVLEVKASSVMKTHDWLREHNPERKDWTFDPAKILPPEPRMYQSI